MNIGLSRTGKTSSGLMKRVWYSVIDEVQSEFGEALMKHSIILSFDVDGKDLVILCSGDVSAMIGRALITSGRLKLLLSVRKMI
jgi:hypothetical protein